MQTKEQLLDIIDETNKLFKSYIELLNKIFKTTENSIDVNPLNKKIIKKEIEESSLRLEDVRKVLANKSREGYTKKVRDLLIKYGAEKLSEINPKNYKILLEEACCLGATLEMIKDEVNKKKDYSDKVNEIFKYHSATSLDDLNKDYYPGVLRDIRGLGNE